MKYYLIYYKECVYRVYKCFDELDKGLYEMLNLVSNMYKKSWCYYLAIVKDENQSLHNLHKNDGYYIKFRDKKYRLFGRGVTSYENCEEFIDRLSVLNNLINMKKNKLLEINNMLPVNRPKFIRKRSLINNLYNYPRINEYI